MATKDPEGWGFPFLSRKSHYFRNGVSLCRRWAFLGPLDPTNTKSASDCVACRRKLEAEPLVTRNKEA